MTPRRRGHEHHLTEPTPHATLILPRMPTPPRFGFVSRDPLQRRCPPASDIGFVSHSPSPDRLPTSPCRLLAGELALFHKERRAEAAEGATYPLARSAGSDSPNWLCFTQPPAPQIGFVSHPGTVERNSFQIKHLALIVPTNWLCSAQNAVTRPRDGRRGRTIHPGPQPGGPDPPNRLCFARSVAALSVTCSVPNWLCFARRLSHPVAQPPSAGITPEGGGATNWLCFAKLSLFLTLGIRP